MNEADRIHRIAQLDVDAEIAENNAQVAMNEGRGDDAARLSERARELRKEITELMT